MKLPRISLTFPDPEHENRIPAASIAESTIIQQVGADMVREEAQTIMNRAAALQATFQGSNLGAEEIAAARQHRASIRLAWKEFHSNLEQDRLVLQVARRVELLELLEELEVRQAAAVARLHSSGRLAGISEVQS
jgi:hypothetical protein